MPRMLRLTCFWGRTPTRPAMKRSDLKAESDPITAQTCLSGPESCEIYGNSVRVQCIGASLPLRTCMAATAAAHAGLLSAHWQLCGFQPQTPSIIYNIRVTGCCLPSSYHHFLAPPHRPAPPLSLQGPGRFAARSKRQPALPVTSLISHRPPSVASSLSTSTSASSASTATFRTSSSNPSGLSVSSSPRPRTCGPALSRQAALSGA